MDYDEGWRDPRPEDYETVTNPERFAPLLDAARDLIDRLVATHRCAALPGTVDDLLHGRDASVTEVVRIVPEGAGSPIVIGFTSFPGLLVRVGHAIDESFPACGCDACNDRAEDLIEELGELIDDVVRGRVVEKLSRRAHEVHRATRSSRSGVGRNRWRGMGPLGTTSWPAWTRRA